MGGGRREVKPGQEGRSDMRHNTSVRQNDDVGYIIAKQAATTRARPGAMAVDVLVVPPNACTAAPSRLPDTREKRGRLTSMTGRPIFLRPLRGELGVLELWNCMCFAGKTAVDLDDACLFSVCVCANAVV
jgi:hypothetical protein